MRHPDPRGSRAQQVVVVAIPATGLVADLEAIRQAFVEPVGHLGWVWVSVLVLVLERINGLS